MNNRDLSAFDQSLSETAIFDFPGSGRIEGRKRILLFFKLLFRKYPRLTFTVEDIITEGKKVCMVWSNEGEDKNGNPYSNRGVTLVKITNKKISFISDYFKDTSFIKPP